MCNKRKRAFLVDFPLMLHHKENRKVFAPDLSTAATKSSCREKNAIFPRARYAGIPEIASAATDDGRISKEKARLIINEARQFIKE